ncbi:MAG: type I-E CRISPR-associated endoribonuclease Cas2e [Gemmatimonadota bacterium]|nr:type I-E CRISPR-associated endoribonuclease Cas2e [Gemmatimonadota bacterium]
MMVIVVENAPPRLRGRLTLWLAEIRAGVYVGNYSVRTRERIWEETLKLLGDGSAALAWTAQTDSGFAFETAGPNRRESVDLDGLTLVRFVAAAGEGGVPPSGAPGSR